MATTLLMVSTGQLKEVVMSATVSAMSEKADGYVTAERP